MNPFLKLTKMVKVSDNIKSLMKKVKDIEYKPGCLESE